MKYTSFKALLEETLKLEFGSAGSGYRQQLMALEYLKFFKTENNLEYYKKEVDDFLKDKIVENLKVKEYYSKEPLIETPTYFQYIINICEKLLEEKNISYLISMSNHTENIDEIVNPIDFITIVKYIDNNTDLKLKLSEIFVTKIIIDSYIGMNNENKKLSSLLVELESRMKNTTDDLTKEAQLSKQFIDEKSSEINKDVSELKQEIQKQNTSNITTLGVFSAIVMSVFGGFSIVETAFINFETPILITLIVFLSIFNIVALLSTFIIKINGIKVNLQWMFITVVNIMFIVLISITLLHNFNIL